MKRLVLSMFCLMPLMAQAKPISTNTTTTVPVLDTAKSHCYSVTYSDKKNVQQKISLYSDKDMNMVTPSDAKFAILYHEYLTNEKYGSLAERMNLVGVLKHNPKEVMLMSQVEQFSIQKIESATCDIIIYDKSLINGYSEVK